MLLEQILLENLDYN